MKLEIKKNLIGVLALVGLIWLIYLINIPLGVTSWDFRNWGLQPRTTSGLVGVFTMPFLHRDMNHILSNTVPLTVLLFMLRASRRTPWRILVSLIVGSGVLLWCFGRSQIHVGASVLIYSLAAYLIAAGIYERKPIAIIISVLVAVMYGALFWGLLPTAGESVSWEGHLFGAVFGGVFAHFTLRRREEGTKTVVAPQPVEAKMTEVKVPEVTVNGDGI